MATTLANLNIVLRAKSDQLRAGLKQASKRVEGMRKKMRMLMRPVNLVRGTLAGLATAFAVGAVKSQIAFVDQLAKTAKKLGTTVEELQKLRHAAELSGVAVRTFDMALQRMVRRVSEAAIGTGEAQAAIKELGLDAKQLSARGPARALEDIAEAFARIKDPADQVRLAFKLFDSEGVQLVTMLQGGATNIRKLGAELEKLGLVTSEEAKRAEELNDAITRLTRSFGAFGTNLIVDVAPMLKLFIEDMTLLTAAIKDAARGWAEFFQLVPKLPELVDMPARIKRENAERERMARAEAVRQQSLADQAKRLAERMKLPAEVFRDTMKQLNEMLKLGLINADVFRRAAEKAQRALQGGRQPGRGSSGAVARGTTEAFSAARQNAMRFKQLAQIEQQKLKIQRNMEKHLRKLAEAEDRGLAIANI